ncbi:hypothetical protein TNCV_4232301 [Trichonephila clavipes]|nr:hypothetical protein TNCV_4232301 [Trichonephila clavipes]
MASLDHQSLPPTNIGRVDGEMVFPANKVVVGWNVTRMLSSLICIWHTGVLIEKDEPTSTLIARLHRSLSDCGSFIITTQERELSVRIPKNERIVMDCVTNPSTSMRGITSQVSFFPMTIWGSLHTNDDHPFPSNMHPCCPFNVPFEVITSIDAFCWRVNLDERHARVCNAH